MPAFAIYRLPHTDRSFLVQQTEGEPEELLVCNELNGRQGFVVAPFEITAEQPICLIRPDRVEEYDGQDAALEKILDTILASADSSSAASAERLHSNITIPHPSEREYYSIDFANFHAQLQAGAFRKLVLSRCVEGELPLAADGETDARVSPFELYRRACEYYPRMFIALVYTPKSGLWLTATPEMLLEIGEREWRTIALAGTQLPGETQWSDKNIQEQRLVATYVAECLEQFTDDFCEEGPYSVRAAHLMHLRSDFTFTLPDGNHLGDVLQALYPTPAVCGLPKRESFNFIKTNEHTPRRYYSGFMGMLRPCDTHLYVSLRCMNIEGTHCRLYAGGGLLCDSNEEQEWAETEAKLETMRRCIATRRT
ncbi:MAG: chorismate-binding protein [Prevotella sp.]|nr:chorismate-binding protein [Prevotella sp.]